MQGYAVHPPCAHGFVVRQHHLGQGLDEDEVPRATGIDHASASEHGQLVGSLIESRLSSLQSRLHNLRQVVTTVLDRPGGRLRRGARHAEDGAFFGFGDGLPGALVCERKGSGEASTVELSSARGHHSVGEPSEKLAQDDARVTPGREEHRS